jgi:diaminohydroxyphosphoribosylaminopyrimidine deaminase / 5-amino-6-(5-phosphoribosylamino)uracil reductase
MTAHGASTPSGDLRHDWRLVLKTFREPDGSLPDSWAGIFDPLRRGLVDGLVVVGQCGQSIDARVATPSGHSHYINGDAGLDHLHRLRALVDAVVVGVGTVIADDPQLTVRRVEGPNPARVIVDPQGRLPASARALGRDTARRIVIRGPHSKNGALASDVERIALPLQNGQIAPATILAALAERGFRRILIEGGADTLSRFLAVRCLDRLHVLVAPIILGAGRTSLSLPAPRKIADALHVAIRAHVLGTDILLDCDLSSQRMPIGKAKQST